MATREVTEYRLANISVSGVIHCETGELIIGDTSIAKIAAEASGIRRQQGRVHIEVFVEPQEMTVTNPDLGVGREASEPAA